MRARTAGAEVFASNIADPQTISQVYLLVVRRHRMAVPEARG